MALIVTAAAVTIACAFALVVIRLFKGWAARTTVKEYEHD